MSCSLNLLFLLPRLCVARTNFWYSWDGSKESNGRTGQPPLFWHIIKGLQRKLKVYPCAFVKVNASPFVSLYSHPTMIQYLSVKSLLWIGYQHEDSLPSWHGNQSSLIWSTVMESQDIYPRCFIFAKNSLRVARECCYVQGWRLSLMNGKVFSVVVGWITPRCCTIREGLPLLQCTSHSHVCCNPFFHYDCITPSESTSSTRQSFVFFQLSLCSSRW